MLQGQHEPPRTVSVKRCCGYAVMNRRIGKAWRANHPVSRTFAERTLAAGTGRLSRDCEFPPAGRAQPTLTDQRSAAQRAARREDKVHDRSKDSRNLHLKRLSLAPARCARQCGGVSTQAPPQIFSPARRLAVRRRALALQAHPNAARYLMDDMAEDLVERLAFLRHEPKRVLLIGMVPDHLVADLEARGAAVSRVDPATGFADEQPFAESGFDLIASFGTLDTVNDLPGALIHIRNALAPGGLAIASFVGAGSLPALRAAMLAADGDRPAPRLHPAVDVRAGGQLLQRAGWADPVVDSRPLDVRFSSLASLLADLRAQALTNVLMQAGPIVDKIQYSVVKEQFGTGTVERFEILTLSGWRR